MDSSIHYPNNASKQRSFTDFGFPCNHLRLLARAKQVRNGRELFLLQMGRGIGGRLANRCSTDPLILRFAGPCLLQTEDVIAMEPRVYVSTTLNTCFIAVLVNLSWLMAPFQRHSIPMLLCSIKKFTLFLKKTYKINTAMSTGLLMAPKSSMWTLGAHRAPAEKPCFIHSMT